jgi:ATP-binding cassette subfamily B protein
MILASQGVVDGQLTLGDLVLINTFLLQLYLPLGFLGFVYREIRHSLTDMERMFSLLEHHNTEPTFASIPDFGNAPLDITFDKVSFSYHPERQILKDISFSIKAGHKVALVGDSGSGKSTLARLLFKFYSPQSGKISVSERDISQIDPEMLRKHIGVVPQDTVLFNSTIYENILYGNPNATRSDVIKAAQHAYIHDFISQLPDGYNTLVGERGLKLSGGEKQRVAIARTILKAPQILILDEATSALDSTAEQSINQALKQLSQHKTTLVIAHRLSTITDADLILVMEQGQIVERGTHQSLVEQDGKYAEMWLLQQSSEHINAD